LTRPSTGDRSIGLVAAAQVGLAIAGLIAFLLFLSRRVPVQEHEHRAAMNPTAGIGLCLFGIAMILAAAVDFRFQLSTKGWRLLVWIGPSLFVWSIWQQLAFAPAVLQVAVPLTLALLLYLLFIARRQNSDRWKRSALQRSAILAAMALSSFAIFRLVRPAPDRLMTGSFLGDLPIYRTWIPVLAMVICLLLDARVGSKALLGLGTRNAQILCDLVVPAILLATIFIPWSQWEMVSLEFIFTHDDHLQHWSYFGVGPALAFAHGRALITGIYSQYGVGWPYLFALLGHAVPFSYANIAGCCIIYGCVYSIAIYVFLRLLLRDAVWAASGAILAVTLQIFSGIFDNTIIWNWPSSTMLRHPLDIWFFLILLGHNRLGGRPRYGSKRMWLMAAGAICGLALLFELDTGIELLLILGFYWLLYCLANSSWKVLRDWNSWTDLLAAGIATAVVWLVGMALASRGTLLHRAFWSEYLEGLHNQAFTGLGLLPIADIPGYAMAIFAGMLTIYFFAIGISSARIWLKVGSEIDLFLGSISAYGLGLLLLFIGRSHPLNLFHPMIPLAIVIMLLLSQVSATSILGGRSSSVGWVLAVASVALLWSKPEFLHYPSLLKWTVTAPAENDDVLSRTKVYIEGSPWKMLDYVNNLRQVASAINELPARDEDIAVLDDWDTVLDCYSGRAPWSRYTSLFYGLLTKTMISQTEHELLARHPRFIIIRAAPPPKWEFNDTWEAFHRFVPRRYRLLKTVGGYEFWAWAKAS
jgi:hypothetical protein